MNNMAQFFFCLLPLMALAAAMPGMSSARSTTGDPFPLQRYTLPNGLRVWIQPCSDSESVPGAHILAG
jgi:hypothetical protein